MKKGLTEIVFILDASGSMSGLEADTIGGFNGLIAKQKKEPGEAIVSTVIFDTESRVVHDRVPIGEVGPLTAAEYSVGGATALLDAVGGAIHHIGNVQKYARDEDRPEKTLVVITTDGEENSSVHYDYARVKRMVQRQSKKYGWEFIFLGANMNAIAAAGDIGIRPERAAQYECDEKGTALNFDVIASVVSQVRERPAESLSADWKRDIEDYRRRRSR